MNEYKMKLFCEKEVVMLRRIYDAADQLLGGNYSPDLGLNKDLRDEVLALENFYEHWEESCFDCWVKKCISRNDHLTPNKSLKLTQGGTA